MSLVIMLTPALCKTAACKSFESKGIALKHIEGSELITLRNLNASTCADACCRHAAGNSAVKEVRVGIQIPGCTAWTLGIAQKDKKLGVTSCFLKNATTAQIRLNSIALPDYTSGCIDGPCPSVEPTPPVTPNPAPSPVPTPVPPPPLPPTLLLPRNSIVHTIAHSPVARLRDPTTALFDPTTRTWHIWMSYKPLNTSHVYATGATIRHYVLNNENLNATTGPPGPDCGLWEDAGEALGPSSVEGAFDFSAVYTPGAAVECRGGDHNTNSTAPPGIPTVRAAPQCTWYLWFGGVSDEILKNESIGVATSSSPYGPYVK